MSRWPVTVGMVLFVLKVSSISQAVAKWWVQSN
jgi:hypothetical protein